MKEIVLFHGDAEDKQFWIPYSIFSLASSLSENGFSVRMFDVNCKNNRTLIWERIEKYLLDQKDNILFVGISVFIGKQIHNSLKFAEIVRRLNYNIPIVWGGWQPSLLPEITIKNSFCDYVLIGQGEESIVQLAKVFMRQLDITEVKGLVYMTDNKIINNTPVTPKRRSILPRYNWELLNLDDYIINDPEINTRTVSYISSQGCPLNCGFCSDSVMYKRHWCSLNAEQVIEDICKLYYDYNINGISFYDSNFLVDKGRAKSIFEQLVQKKIKIKWVAAGDIIQLLKFSDEDWKLMKSSGCCKLLIGAESGDNEILKLIGKEFDIDNIIEIALKAAKHGIGLYFTFITGWPPFPKMPAS